MYLDFHKFREKPFNLTPDPRFVFLSKNHKEAFAHLLYGIKNRVGFIALTGEVGSGKTTILRTLFSRLDANHYRTALIFNPCLSSAGLLENINREFGLVNNSPNDSNLLDPLNRFLLQQNTEGRTVVLAIDEAQNLETQVLEQIRLISNLETDKDKLIQIILAGQPELIQILDRKEMRQLTQRITVQYHLQPLDFKDTVNYIKHRLKVAGGRDGKLFSKDALRLIYAYSKGLPRLVNAACDRMLLTSYTREKTKINLRIAIAGMKDIKKNTLSYNPKKRFALISTAVLITGLFAGGMYLKWNDNIHSFNTPVQFKILKNPSEISDEKLFHAMTAQLGGISETDSALKAFNYIASLWNVDPVSESTELNTPDWMESAALSGKLNLYRFSGNMGTLLRLYYPAVLEFTLPGIQGKRFIALVGIKNDKALIKPEIAGRDSISFRELEKYWSGYGIILWKDFSDILDVASAKSQSNDIRRLQDLLKEAGVYRKPLTGVYDQDTSLAVKKFQSLKGIKEDGIAGSQTLMLLYRSIDRFQVPGLSKRQK